MKILNPLFITLRFITLVIGIALWLLMYPFLYLRQKLTKDKIQKLTKHPNIAMIFIYKVIDNLYKNYIVK